MYFSRYKGLTYKIPIFDDPQKKQEIKVGNGISRESEFRDEKERRPLENLVEKLKVRLECE